MIGADRRVDLTGPQATWPAAARRLWREATEHVLGLPDSWHPPPWRGDPRLREVLGSILGSPPDDLVITCGVRAGASVIARTARRVLHERPSFTGTVAVLRSFRSDLELCTWEEMSERGRNGGSVVWLTTPCRNPDGATLSRDDWAWVDALASANQVVVNEVYRW